MCKQVTCQRPSSTPLAIRIPSIREHAGLDDRIIVSLNNETGPTLSGWGRFDDVVHESILSRGPPGERQTSSGSYDFEAPVSIRGKRGTGLPATVSAVTFSEAIDGAEAAAWYPTVSQLWVSSKLNER